MTSLFPLSCHYWHCFIYFLFSLYFLPFILWNLKTLSTCASLVNKSLCMPNQLISNFHVAFHQFSLAMHHGVHLSKKKNKNNNELLHPQAVFTFELVTTITRFMFASHDLARSIYEYLVLLFATRKIAGRSFSKNQTFNNG